MVQVREPFASHTDMLQTDASSLSIIVPSSLNLEYHLQQLISSQDRNSADIFLAPIRVHAAARVPDITNFNPVPVAACLMDSAV